MTIVTGYRLAKLPILSQPLAKLSKLKLCPEKRGSSKRCVRVSGLRRFLPRWSFTWAFLRVLSAFQPLSVLRASRTTTMVSHLFDFRWFFLEGLPGVWLDLCALFWFEEWNNLRLSKSRWKVEWSWPFVWALCCSIAELVEEFIGYKNDKQKSILKFENCTEFSLLIVIWTKLKRTNTHCKLLCDIKQFD